MKIDGCYSAVFILHFTKADIDLLCFESAHHYDSTCKAASMLGGFIYGWKGRFDFLEEPTVEVNADSRQLDLCLKILEFSAEPLAAEISMNMHRAFSFMSEKVHGATFEDIGRLK